MFIYRQMLSLIAEEGRGGGERVLDPQKEQHPS